MKMKNKLLFIFALFFTSVLSYGQTKQITGTVYDETDLTLPGANVIVKGTQTGTTTDFDGNFSIEASAGDIIEVTFMGYQVKDVTIGASDIYTVKLDPDSQALDEVIVVAYGTTKKESFVGSAGVVGSKHLETRTLSSVTQALEGSTTGLQVSSSSGQPGSAPSIRVRGFGTLNGSADPLYIVDGAQFEGDISAISPDDIASMTILKDASSTALYGSRAANGVVMITTKKGSNTSGDVKMNFKAVGGVVTRGIPYYEVVEAKDYYELMGEAYKNSLIHSSGMSPGDAEQEAYTNIFKELKYNPFDVDNDKILGSDGKINPNANVIFPDLNWYDPLEQTGYRQNYNLSASGGGEKHTYFFSLGYLDETGYMTNSDYNRINARINLNMTPKKWLKIGTNFSGSIIDKGLASTSSSNTGYSNPFYFARSIGPIYPVYVVDPKTGAYIKDSGGNKIYDLGEGYPDQGINPRPSGAFNGRHIVAELDYNNNFTKINNISNRTFLEFTIIEDLKFTTNASVDINNYRQSNYENDIVGDGAPNGRYSETRYIRTVVNFNQLLNYSFSYKEDHSFDILLGHESFSRNYSNMYGMKSQQIVEGIYEFDNFVTPTSLSGYSTDKRNEGYFSRINYDYLSKYYISASYRYDGSSVFHEDIRWGGFYSVGLSWRISEENFIEDVTWIDNLKLRTSYGEVGNDNLNGDYYAFRALYSTRPNGLSPGLYPSTLGNQNLTWESNKSFDIALDFGLFNNRLTGSVEFYKRISEDLLYNLPIPPSVGLDTQPRNVATIYNQGFEFGLGVEAINNDDFRWKIDFQASTIKNEITDIPDPFINGSKRWKEGHSIYDYFLYDYYGVNEKTGAAQYYQYEEDADGNTTRKYNPDGTPVITEDYASANKGYTGTSSIPDFFGSITNRFTYKQFSLDFLFTYSLGGETLDYNYASLMNNGDYGSSLHIDQKEGWREDGDKTNIPRLENGNVNIAPSTSSRWLTSSSYFAFKNINLSYSFDQNTLDKLKLGNLRVFATGENLFVLTARKGMNPQQSFSGTTSNVYLPSRVFSIGVDVGF